MLPKRMAVLILLCTGLSACVPAAPGPNSEPGPPPGFPGPDSDDDNSATVAGGATVGG